MTRYQGDILNMLMLVEKYFDKNAAIWSGIAPIADTKTELSANIAAIAAASATQQSIILGVAIQKSDIRKTVELQSRTISTALCAYATIHANQELYNSSLHSPSKLSKYKGAELIGNALHLHQLATEHQVALGPYLIVAATLSNYMAAIMAFNEVLKTTSEAITTRQEATNKIKELMKNTMQLLYKKMDNIVIILQDSEPGFVAGYKIARNIINSPTYTLSLATTCIDSITRQPVAGVALHIMPRNIRRKSSAKGRNSFLHLSPGKNTLKVSHPQYEAQTLSISIVKKQMQTLSIALVAKDKKE